MHLITDSLIFLTDRGPFAAIRWASEQASRFGITSTQEAAATKPALLALNAVDAAGELKQRVAAHLVLKSSMFGGATFSLPETDRQFHSRNWMLAQLRILCAGRIAEVTARFTLDALPGKQMAIDADMNAGMLTQEEARERRDEVRREADFYGSMDGASKFVRGDAVAGILILFINIIGGLTIGMVQHELPLSEAVRNYTLLTIGDGLVAQIPALLISSSAAIIVTRVSGQQELGKRRQLLQNAMKHLNERERHILNERRLRDNPTTLEELSQHYGISRERVRQIEVRAFETLQKAMRNAALEERLGS